MSENMMSENRTTCADCDELLLDHFEGTLSGQLRTRFDDHVSSCARCQSLIRDVDGIREQAAVLPELVPSRDLWSGIESRIQSPVIRIAERPAGQFSRRWLAAAAAALIVATSGVTYVATTRSFTTPVDGGPPRSSSVPSRVAVSTPLPGVAEQPVATEAPVVPSAKGPAAAGLTRREPSNAPRPAALRSSLASAGAAAVAAPSPSDLAFAGEISQLQSVLAERRAQLDPETVKVVEDNLKLIDTAVKRARSALAKDPASSFLTRQLDNALEKKVDLLRTVALLPSST